MASQSYILNYSAEVDECKDAVDALEKAFANEIKINGGEVYPENRPVWAETYRLVRDLVEKLDKLEVDMAEKFGSLVE